MGRKSAMTKEQLVEVHKKMVANDTHYALAAKEAGVNPATLYNLLKKNGLEFKVGKRGRVAKVAVAA